MADDHGESQPQPALWLERLADGPKTLGRTSPHDKVQDQGDNREYQQQVDETACHMKHGESANPCDQKYNEQYRPDAH
jgi:hypothetical protein